MTPHGLRPAFVWIVPRMGRSEGFCVPSVAPAYVASVAMWIVCGRRWGTSLRSEELLLRARTRVYKGYLWLMNGADLHLG